MKVIATARGFMHGRIIEPGEAFVLADQSAFSGEWMKAADALDHDADGRKGGSKPGRKKRVPVSLETDLEIDQTDDEVIAMARELTGRDGLTIEEAREIVDAAGGE